MNATPPTDPGTPGQPDPTLTRQILNLAIPALGTLLAQPLFTTIDSAMVGHLGTAPLAGLAISSTILMTTFGLFIFLAYSTTSITAKHFGAGNQTAGLQAGLDALWLALFCGLGATLVLLLFSPQLITWLGASPTAFPHAVSYLQFAAPGLVGMLISLAATGTLRGLLDTRTPLLVATVGAAVNAVLNAILIFGLDLGIAGSALGTAVSELGMGAFLAFRVLQACRAQQVRAVANFRGIFKASRTGAPLIIRTLSMRICLLFTVVALTRAGDLAVAGNQIVATIWGFAVFSLDALAIAAQALVGRSLGAQNPAQTQQLLCLLTRWGVVAGGLLGLLVAAAAPVLPWLFTSDPQLLRVALVGLWVSAPFYLLAGYVFILDGVLIGAGDNRYLAFAATLVMVAFLPALLVFERFFPEGGASGVSVPVELAGQTGALGIIWLLYGVIFMGGRAATLFWRTRGTSWQGAAN